MDSADLQDDPALALVLFVHLVPLCGNYALLLTLHTTKSSDQRSDPLEHLRVHQSSWDQYSVQSTVWQEAIAWFIAKQVIAEATPS